jgi:alpha-D-ribose 1-methylphosphonate 5-triphosphate synthase subunit PhnH
MITPTMTANEARVHGTFIALMQALSFPGRPRELGVPADQAILAIADALIDLETSFFTPDPALASKLALTGARSASCQLAGYHFYPKLTAADAAALRDAPIGSYALPDDSATIVIGCDLPRLLDGSPDSHRLHLSGPGIRDKAELLVGRVPSVLWEVRAEAIRYPLGWDIFLVSGSVGVGIARTTRVEVV